MRTFKLAAILLMAALHINFISCSKDEPIINEPIPDEPYIEEVFQDTLQLPVSKVKELLARSIGTYSMPGELESIVDKQYRPIENLGQCLLTITNDSIKIKGGEPNSGTSLDIKSYEGYQINSNLATYYKLMVEGTTDVYTTTTIGNIIMTEHTYYSSLLAFKETKSLELQEAKVSIRRPLEGYRIQSWTLIFYLYPKQDN